MPYRKIFFGFSLIASLMLWGASVATWDLPLSATAFLSALGLEKIWRSLERTESGKTELEDNGQ